MNKQELISRVSAKSGCMRKDTEAFVSIVLEEIISALERGEDVRLSGFGTFSVHERDGYIARNPKTNTPVTVAPSRTVKFRPGKALKLTADGNHNTEE